MFSFTPYISPVNNCSSLDLMHIFSTVASHAAHTYEESIQPVSFNAGKWVMMSTQSQWSLNEFCDAGAAGQMRSQMCVYADRLHRHLLAPMDVVADQIPMRNFDRFLVAICHSKAFHSPTFAVCILGWVWHFCNW